MEAGNVKEKDPFLREHARAFHATTQLLKQFY
jgi:hypothetical protein